MKKFILLPAFLISLLAANAFGAQAQWNFDCGEQPGSREIVTLAAGPQLIQLKIGITEYTAIGGPLLDENKEYFYPIRYLAIQTDRYERPGRLYIPVEMFSGKPGKVTLLTGSGFTEDELQTFKCK